MSGLLGLSAQVTFSIRGVAIDMAFGNVGALCSRRVFLRWTFATRVGVRPKAVSNDAAQVYNPAIANAQTSQSIYRRVVGSWWVARSAACLGVPAASRQLVSPIRHLTRVALPVASARDIL